MNGPRCSARSVVGLVLVGCAAQPVERVEPPATRLQATGAHALGGKWSNLTAFCLRQDGSPIEIQTMYASGDPELDAVYRETVAQWRYQPTSSSRDRCRNVRFDQDFGPERRPSAEGQEGAVKTDEPPFKPRGLYTPTPPMVAVAPIAKAAKMSNWTLISRTAFCVQRDGHVYDVKTLRSTGLEALDRVVRATIASWRYAAFPDDQPAPCVSTEVQVRFKIP